jgi:hypothetical protein
MYHLRQATSECEPKEETRSTHPLRMQVVNGLCDNLQHRRSLPLREELLPQNLVQQLSAIEEIRNQVDLVAIVITLKENKG